MIWTLRYGLVFLGVALILGGTVGALGSRTTSNIITTLHLTVPVMIAALVEGMQHARVTKAKPSRSAVWRWAVVATVMATCLAVVLAYAVPGLTPAFAGLPMGGGLARNLMLLAGVYLLANRFLFTFGVSGHLNTMRSRGEIE